MIAVLNDAVAKSAVATFPNSNSAASSVAERSFRRTFQVSLLTPLEPIPPIAGFFVVVVVVAIDCGQLLRNAIAWHEYLSEALLQALLINNLVNMKLLPYIRQQPIDSALLLCSQVQPLPLTLLWILNLHAASGCVPCFLVIEC